MDHQKNISQFVAAAREYCAWVEGTKGSNDVFDAIRLLSRLHAEAVMLPGIEDKYLPEADDIPDCPDAQKQAAIERFRNFPFQYYWEIYTPVADQPEEPVCGDIADDFSDIYSDIKSGLLAYDSGREAQAVWHWWFTWGIHWGDHATSALRTLHSYQKNCR